MNPVDHYSVPHLALWKSSAARVLDKHAKKAKSSAKVAASHQKIMQATDRYCNAMERNESLEDPGHESTDEMAVGAYLSYLHHRKAHARIAKDEKHEKELEEQIARFKFGNPLWQQMFVQYYKYYWQYPYHKGAKPKYRSWKAKDAGNGDINYGVIEWKLPKNARVAIVGDIGIGTDVAAAVLEGALKFNPDVILHLGDVYYSGTKREMRQRLVNMVRKVLKKHKKKIPFFTIPGNHEYFTGAVPYLDTLDSNKLIYKKSQQQQTSYFCLGTEDDSWQFLAMDTGYHGHYMNVAKGAQKATLERLHIGPIEKPKASDDPNWPTEHNPYFLKEDEANLPQLDPTKPVDMVTIRPDELEWHQDKLEKFKGRTLILSHHQLYSALDVVGVAQKTLPNSKELDPNDFNRPWINTGLWKQFGQYFGDQIAAWLWGHEHNLVIFEDGYRPDDWPKNEEAEKIYKTLPKGRCAGHSALPVQDTEEPYNVNYPVPLVSDDVKLGLTTIGQYTWYNHGFQLMELRGKGNPARLTYFQIAGDDPTPLPLYMELIK